MAVEQELRDRISQLEKLECDRLKAAAVATELNKFELAPGAAQQLTDLIMPSVGTTTLTDGRVVAFGPEYRPLEAHIASILQRDDYAHYLRGKATAQAAPQGPQPAGPPALAGASAAREILPGETFGTAMIRVALANQAQQVDARVDLSRPMGIGHRGLLPR